MKKQKKASKKTRPKIALITGITGQDGSYLAEFLLDKGYEVHGIIRRSSSFATGRIDHNFHKLNLHYGDLADATCASKIIQKIQPDEVYNLAAQSHVRVSFDMPEYTSDIDALGTLRLLEALKNYKHDAKFYQASSSEMFGMVQEVPQTEKTPFYPRSPYGCAKLYSHWITKNYRESYDMFTCSGILFNHESPRRGETFVTKKITRALARIKLNKQDKLKLGNLYAKRDWGYAKDYIEAMWLMLQHSKPDDFVIATNETYSVKNFVEESAKVLGIDLIWRGKGDDEKGIDKKTGKVIVEIDKRYFRPAEVDLLIGNPAKAKKVLGWKPKTSFKELVKIMTEHDYEQEKSNAKN